MPMMCNADTSISEHYSKLRGYLKKKNPKPQELHMAHRVLPKKSLCVF